MDLPEMSNSDELNAKLDKLLAFVSRAQEQLEPFKAQKLEVSTNRLEARRAYEEQMQVLRDRENELDQQMFEKQSLLNKASTAAEQIRAELARIKHEEEEAARKAAEEAARLKALADAKAENAALTERFDLLTTAAPWREWAKDHQIQAGHQLTQDRYVILADPMGLGKTLSSIITTDMAERVTTEADAENPFLGIEKDVWIGSQYVWTPHAELTGFNWPPYSDTVPTSGTPVGGMSYDQRNDLAEKGLIEYQQGHYEKQIVNGITRPTGRKILYFCPSALLRNVMSEWRNWSPHRSVLYIGGMTRDERKFALSMLDNAQEFVVICNYEAWRRDKAMLESLKGVQFDTVIIDEAHNIKDMKSVAFKGINEVVNNGYSRPEFVIPMTGTPILNKPQELFPLLHIIDPETYHTEKDFLWDYCEQNDEGKWGFKEGGQDALIKKLGRRFIRRTKEQVGINLPEKSVIYHELELDSDTYQAQSKVRTQMRDYAQIVIDESKGKTLDAMIKIALITRLRQIETWPAGIIQRDKTTKEVVLEVDVHESQKIDYIINAKDQTGLIPDVIGDERIVVFSQFKAALHEMKQRAESLGYRAAVMDGDTSPADREFIHRDFNRNHTPNRADSHYDVVFCHYRVGGVGLNLTAATTLIALDEEWNGGKRDQAFDRIHRMGQTDPVTIHVVRIKKTIDDWLANLLEHKDSMVGGFNEAISSADFKDALDSGLI